MLGRYQKRLRILRHFPLKNNGEATFAGSSSIKKTLSVGEGFSSGADDCRQSSVVSHHALQLLELLEQLLALRYRARLVDLHVADDALVVEHVGGALVHAALLVEDAVGLAD